MELLAFGNTFGSEDFFPLAFEIIATAQQNDLRLQNKMLSNASYEQRILRATHHMSNASYATMLLFTMITKSSFH
jgi:hypothetical protein